MIAIAMIGLSGCGGAEPAATGFEMSLLAGAGINPDATGRPSPVGVKVYALATNEKFESADFFPLYETPSETLGQDLLSVETLTIRPGAAMDLDFESLGMAKYIGVVAAFQDIDNSRWRAIAVVKPDKKNKLKVSIDARAVMVVED